MAETPDPKITKTAARRFAVLQKEQLYGEGKGNGAILVKFGKGREGKGRAEAVLHSSPACLNAHPLVPVGHYSHEL